MTLLILVMFIGAVYVTFSLWNCWLAWRRERIQRDAMFIVNSTSKIGATQGFEKDFPSMADYAVKALPWLQQTLVEAIAKKHNKTPQALVEALLADTGTTSLEDALRSPMSSLQSSEYFLKTD